MEIRPRDSAQPPIEEMYRIARQYSRREEEADDLVQDLLLEAVSTGRDFADIRFMAWGRGFLRNRAAFVARTEGRRRKREAQFDPHAEDSGIRVRQLPERFITTLRPSLQLVARLVNCGLDRKEIRYVLNIADTALRQRMTALRQAWRAYLVASGQQPEYAEESSRMLPSGLIRRSLTGMFKQTAARHTNTPIIGSHDPDGHLFTIRSIPAHKTDPHGNNTPDKPGKARHV